VPLSIAAPSVLPRISSVEPVHLFGVPRMARLIDAGFLSFPPPEEMPWVLVEDE
jgi:hypothetical protein